MVHCISLTLQVACRYGVSYVLHRIPAVANIMEYHKFAQQTMSSHDRTNKQATLDVFAPMDEILPACLKELCGSSVVEDTEAVGRLIAENVTAMSMSPQKTFKGLADSATGTVEPLHTQEHVYVRSHSQCKVSFSCKCAS